jgi:hypothetical protein
MKISKKLVIVLVVLTSVFITSCRLSDMLKKKPDSSYYSFKIVTQGNAGAYCTGYYIITAKGKTENTKWFIDTDFSPNTTTNGTSYHYSIDKDLDNPTSVTISATGRTDSSTGVSITSSIDLYIYVDDKMVKSLSSVSSDTSVASVNLTYDFSADDTTTTTKSEIPSQNNDTPAFTPMEEPVKTAPATQEEIDKELIEKNQEMILF